MSFFDVMNYISATTWQGNPENPFILTFQLVVDVKDPLLGCSAIAKDDLGQLFLAFPGNGDFLKLAMADDKGIIITHGNTGDKALTHQNPLFDF